MEHIEELVTDLIANSQIARTVIFEKCLVVACKLPSGFIMVEHAATLEEEVTQEIQELLFDVCMENIYSTLYEAELYTYLSLKPQQEKPQIKYMDHKAELKDDGQLYFGFEDNKGE